MDGEDDGAREDHHWLEPSPNQNRSNGQARYARSQGVPSDTGVPEGVTELNTALRSVVTNRAIFETFLGLNDDVGKLDETSFLKKIFTEEELNSLNFWSTPPDQRQMNGLLSGPAKQSTEETKITKAMVDALHNFFNEDSSIEQKATATRYDSGIEVLAEARLESLEQDKQRSEPKLDITFGRNNRLLAFAEVGLIKKAAREATMSMSIDDLFWHKMHQIMNYLKRLNKGVLSPTGDANHVRFKASNTFLFSVIVFEKSDQSIGRMAIFCAEPKDEDGTDFRVVMMWRTEFRDIERMDAAYTAFVRATMHLANRQEVRDYTWQYLGPACTQVATLDGQSSYVLRSYDNRVCSTPRSPCVYQSFSLLESEQVFKFEDPGPFKLLEFGELLQPSYNSRLSMLFYDDSVSRKGQIEVIAVPFLEGSHGFTTIDQAIDAVKFSEKLHEEGFVHGDFRAFNIVASTEEGRSQPIDFDFGGSFDSVKYPPGYVPSPPDGDRPGKEGQLITKEHDVQSLITVLFDLHEPKPDLYTLRDMVWDCTGRDSEERKIILGEFETFRRDSEFYYRNLKTMKQVREALERLKDAVELLKGCMETKGLEGHNFPFTFRASHRYDTTLMEYEGPKLGRPAKEEKKKSTRRAGRTPAPAVGRTAKQGTPWGAQYTPSLKVQTPRKRHKRTPGLSNVFRPSNVENQVPGK